MLNVPETVKALFKADGVRKNFRVQFPNGELPDITNDNIVQESVKFTESLCTQDVLKFGLTEASVIEFETVGVANMYGMTIECGIEIDLSSLSASEIAEIAAGSWDGIYVSESDSDIGFPFFRVPYGVFRVESCPRDHQAMTHRRVQAYTYSPSDLNENPFEIKKQETINLYTSYNPNVYKLMLETVGYTLPRVMTDEGFTSEDVTMEWAYPSGSQRPELTFTVEVKDAQGATYTVACAFTYQIGYTQTNPKRIDMADLYSADLHGVIYDTVLLDIANALRDDPVGIDLEQSGFDTWRNLARATLTDNDSFGEPFDYLYPGILYYTEYDSGSISGKTQYQKTDIRQTTPVLYPYVNEFSGQIRTYAGTKTVDYIFGTFVAPRSISIFITGDDVFRRIYQKSFESGEAATFKHFIPTNAIPDLALEIEPARTGDMLVDRAVNTGASYSGKISAKDVIAGVLELMAEFGKISRKGTFELVRLSNASPEAIHPGNYQEFWWDEFDVLPIGTARYTYTDDERNEILVDYEFGEGGSIYDLSDNEVLKVMAGANEQSVNAVIDDLFVPHLGPIAFTPVDMTM